MLQAVEDVVRQVRARRGSGAASGDGPFTGPVPLIGIAGAQGSGKTTLAHIAAERMGGVQLSLDDVYLTLSERRRLAADVHPLLAVRGPPLSHDLGLLTRTIAALETASPDALTALPAFDKRADDRRPVQAWPRFRGRPGVIVVDGWCLGARAQTRLEAADVALAVPINELEADDDPEGTWRRASDRALAGPYRRLFARFDALVFLAAPTFDVVLDWRCQQEAELMGLQPLALPNADRVRVARFIQSFERISRAMIDGEVDADLVIHLDDKRTVTSVRAGSRVVGT